MSAGKNQTNLHLLLLICFGVCLGVVLVILTPGSVIIHLLNPNNQYVSQVSGAANEKQMLASKLSQAGDNTAALEAIDQSLELDSSNYWAWLSKGSILRNLGRYQESLTALDQAYQINQDDPYIWEQYGWTYEKTKNYPEMLKTFQKATGIELPEKYGTANRNSYAYQAWYGTAKAQYNLGRYQDAIESSQKAIQYNSSASSPWILEGKSQIKLQQYESAVISLESAIELSPSYAEAWYQKGVALESLGRISDADTSYAMAAGLDPKYKKK